MAEPVAARVAASVLLLRDAPAGVETWLMHRVSRMAFAPSMSVFPGGGVDAVDAGGSDDPRTADRFGVPPAEAGILLRCAVREVAEETGVALAAADLQPWARWITPEAEPRRYDTFFYVAALPDGATAASISTEAAVAEWVSVGGALAQYERGERAMLPPTVHNLRLLAEHRSVASVLRAAAARLLTPIMPTLRPDGDGRWVADLGTGELMPLPAGFGSPPRPGR